MDKKFKEAKTIVYWDVEDFPNTTDGSIHEMIKLALEREGYVGEVSIKAYGEKQPENLNVDGELITFTRTKSEKRERQAKMTFDISFGSLDFVGKKKKFEAVNLFVIAKNHCEDVMFLDELDFAMYHKNMNVVGAVVVPGGRPIETPVMWRPCKYWMWETLLAGGEALMPEEASTLLESPDGWALPALPPLPSRKVVDDVNSETGGCPYCKVMSCGEKNLVVE